MSDLQSELLSKMQKLCDWNNCSINDVTAFGRVTEKHVRDMEQLYDLTLPDEYRTFLVTYGYWLLDFELLGISVWKEVSFQAMTVTLLKQTSDFPTYSLVIENVDEFQYCLDLHTGSVGSWDRDDPTMHVEYDSFYAYFNDRLDDCIENMEE